MNCFKRWNSIPVYHGLFGNLPWRRLKSPHNLSSTFVFLKLCITSLITTTFSIIHLFWHKSNMSYRIYNLIKKWPQASIYWLITPPKKKKKVVSIWWVWASMSHVIPSCGLCLIWPIYTLDPSNQRNSQVHRQLKIYQAQVKVKLLSYSYGERETQLSQLG